MVRPELDEGAADAEIMEDTVLDSDLRDVVTERDADSPPAATPGRQPGRDRDGGTTGDETPVTPGGPRTWRDRLWTLAPSFIPGLAMFLIGRVQAGTPSLGWDEYATASISQRTLPQIFDMAGWMDASIAPYYLLIHFWTAVFGVGEMALRMPSILGMAIGVGLIGELGRRLFSAHAGLVAGLMLALIPAMSRYAQEARAYGLAFMLVALATLLLYLAVARPTWQRWIWYGVVVCLAGLVHMFALMMLAGHAYILISRCWKDQRPAVYRWVTVTTVAVALDLPLILIGLSQKSRQLGWIDPVTAAVVRNAPGGMVMQEGIAWLLLGLAVLGVTLRKRATIELAILGLVPVAALLAVSVVSDPLWVPRYVMYVLGPLALVAAAAMHGAWWRSGAVLLLIAVLASPVQQQVRGPGNHAPSFRWVAGVVSAGEQPGDGLVYGSNDHRWTRAWTNYYLRDDAGRPKDLLLQTSAAERGRLEAQECGATAECIGTTRRIWLIQLTRGKPYSPASPADTAGSAADVLRADYHLVNSWTKSWSVVSLYERNAK